MKILPSIYYFAIRDHRIIFFLLIVFATFLLAMSWLFRSESPLSSILIELGAGIALFALLFFVEHRVLTKRIEASDVRHAESMNAVSKRVHGVEEVAEELHVSINDLRRSTQNRLDADRRMFVSRLDDLISNIVFDNIAYVLERSLMRNEISKRGVRIDLEDQWSRLRFQVNTDSNAHAKIDAQGDMKSKWVSIHIESLAGEQRGCIDWHTNDAPDEIFAKVAIELQVGIICGRPAI